MFEQIAEQFPKPLQPVGKLIAINARTTEHLVRQQVNLFGDLVREGVGYAQDLTSQRDVSGVIEVQSNYVGMVQEKVTTAAKDVYEVLSENHEQSVDVLRAAFSGQALSDSEESVNANDAVGTCVFEGEVIEAEAKTAADENGSPTLN